MLYSLGILFGFAIGGIIGLMLSPLLEKIADMIVNWDLYFGKNKIDRSERTGTRF